MEAGNEQDKPPIVYELWSDDDLCWIEIACPTLELAAFLEAWCEKNSSIFRRRPYGARKPRRQVADRHGVAVDSKGRIS